MSEALVLTADLAAITILAFVLYFPRHRRKDMVVAYLGLNVGVLAVANALSSTQVGTGLGLGLFGVLSIIRLRSAELDHQEVAYYFASLALGLLAGFETSPQWMAPVLMPAVLVALYIGDHPRLFSGYRMQWITLDRAYTDEAELTQELARMLGARIHRVAIRSVDMVNDMTVAEVRYQLVEAGDAVAERVGPRS